MEQIVLEDGSSILSNRSKIFDPVKLKCVDRQKLAIDGECSSYKECIKDESISLFEKWRTTSCGESMHFDESTQSCVPAFNSTCGKFIF